VAAVRLAERTIATANDRSASVSLVDLYDQSVVEQKIGGWPSAIVAKKEFLLVTDAQSHALQAWRRSGEKLERMNSLTNRLPARETAN
jgi:hypothetical protein